MADLIDIILDDAGNNTPGNDVNIVIVAVADLETVPVPVLGDPLGVGTIANLATITADAVTKEGKVFTKIKAIPETVKLDTKTVGGNKSKGVENMLEFGIPGNTKEALGFISKIKNGSYIFFVRDRDGQIRMFGTSSFPAQLVDSSGGSGAARGDDKSFTFSFESVGSAASPVFEGAFMENPVGAGAAVERTDLFQ
jgi:hypothetical protein